LFFTDADSSKEGSFLRGEPYISGQMRWKDKKFIIGDIFIPVALFGIGLFYANPSAKNSATSMPDNKGII
jgi:hypothetical protein